METNSITNFLQGFDAKAKEIANHIKSNSVDSIEIHGDGAAGKTTLLRHLEKNLKSNGMPTVLLNPPANQYDSGIVALLQLGKFLKETSLDQHDILNFLTEPKNSWDSKVEKIHQGLHSASVPFVILMDEPNKWTTHISDDNFIMAKNESLISTIFSSSAKKIYSGKYVSGKSKIKIDCDFSTDSNSFLEQTISWPNSLKTIATDLFREIGTNISKYSPLHIRLIIGLSALTDVSWVAARFQDLKTRKSTADKLIEVVLDKGYRDFFEGWLKLSLVRREITDTLFNLATSDLSEDQRDIFRHCVLFGEPHRLELHDTLKADIRAASFPNSNEIQKKFHRVLTEHYVNEFQRNRDPNIELLSVESYYHAIQSGDFKLLKSIAPMFVDQLNFAGYFMSFLMKNYEKAADLFKLALSWDSEDAYANHYFAYNLDIQAKDRKLIEAHYEKSLKLAPDKPRYHAHKINFLISLGKTDSATAAWQKAVDQIMVGENQNNLQVFEKLHRPVAKLFLSRGLLEEAKQTLNGIPDTLRDEKDSQTLKLIDVLQEEEDVGSYISLALRLKSVSDEGPMFIKVPPQGKLSKWAIGRIVYKDTSRIRAFSKIKAKSGKIQFATLEWKLSEFNKIVRKNKIKPDLFYIGTFIELGSFSVKGKAINTVVSIVRAEFFDFEPAKVFPDPDRYLNANSKFI